MKDNIFKSKVYHLFHGHETKRDNDRFEVFNRHKAYDREGWLDHLIRNGDWGHPNEGSVIVDMFKPYVNETILYAYKNSERPRITICMTNFLRYEMLVKSLTRILSFNIPLNIILWVNGSDNMSSDTRNIVTGLLEKFNQHDIIYSKKNMGTGYPRYMMFNKARFEYDTDFVMTMDDDTIHMLPESLILGATALEQKRYSDYGAMGLWCYPHYQIVRKNNGVLSMEKPKEGFYDVDCLGAATMTFRRSILDTCNSDPQFIIGLVDWDFSLSIRSEGYKLGLICDDRYKPVNDTSLNTREYVDSRWDETVIHNSKQLFKKKWALEIK